MSVNSTKYTDSTDLSGETELPQGAGSSLTLILMVLIFLFGFFFLIFGGT